MKIFGFIRQRADDCVFHHIPRLMLRRFGNNWRVCMSKRLFKTIYTFN